MSTVASPIVHGASLTPAVGNQFSAWDEPAASVSATSPAPPVNVGMTERFASVAGGAALALWGLSQRRMSWLLTTGAGAALIYRGVTGHCHAYDALGITTAEHANDSAVPAQQGVHVEKSVTINRPAADLFQFWRNVENVPQVMRRIASIEAQTGHRSHWVAVGPLDMKLNWDVEIFNERDGELIAWRSLPGGDVETAGSIRFEPSPHGRGTIVHLVMTYNPPAGKLGDRVASLFGQGLSQEMAADLQRFKSLMEAGEIPTTSGQTSGRTVNAMTGADR